MTMATATAIRLATATVNRVPTVTAIRVATATAIRVVTATAIRVVTAIAIRVVTATAVRLATAMKAVTVTEVATATVNHAPHRANPATTVTVWSRARRPRVGNNGIVAENVNPTVQVNHRQVIHKVVQPLRTNIVRGAAPEGTNVAKDNRRVEKDSRREAQQNGAVRG